jgi:hypothetical protein
VLGLIVSQLFGVFVATWFEGITGVPISPVLTPSAVLMATFLGLLIPIVAAILPIRNALGKLQKQKKKNERMKEEKEKEKEKGKDNL